MSDGKNGLTSPPTASTDIYREGAAIAFEVPLDQVTRVQRQLFKERFFLLVYDRRTTAANVGELVKAVGLQLRAQLRAERP
jgi:hypothetical protein